MDSLREHTGHSNTELMWNKFFNMSWQNKTLDTSVSYCAMSWLTPVILEYKYKEI